LQVKSSQMKPIVNDRGKSGETGVLRRFLGQGTYGER
jgi:hypothetical protein